MRALILVAGAALALAACSSKESANNTVNVDENLGAEMNAPDLNATDMNAMDMNATDMNATTTTTTNETTTTTTNNAM